MFPAVSPTPVNYEVDSISVSPVSSPQTVEPYVPPQTVETIPIPCHAPPVEHREGARNIYPIPTGGLICAPNMTSMDDIRTERLRELQERLTIAQAYKETELRTQIAVLTGNNKILVDKYDAEVKKNGLLFNQHTSLLRSVKTHAQENINWTNYLVKLIHDQDFEKLRAEMHQFSGVNKMIVHQSSIDSQI